MVAKEWDAPGRPGHKPTWTSSAKTTIGGAISSQSRVWFSINDGILNEIYHPYIDHATTRDFGLLVTDGRDFFSEEKCDTEHQIQALAQGAAGYCLTNTCRQSRYRIIKKIVTDPWRDVLLQEVRFEALEGSLEDYRLYALIAPHIANQGEGNNGWLGQFRGLELLVAQRDAVALALACSAGWAERSCGFVGVSDGWRDLREHKKLTQHYTRACAGNIALVGGIDLAACGGKCVLALGFGRTASEAGLQARASLQREFDAVAKDFIQEWIEHQKRWPDKKKSREKDGFDLYRVSTSVLKTNESKRFRGAVIASLSIPWGEAHGDNDFGGYHVVWPRDQVEAAGAMLSLGDEASARETLFYLICTQEPDGHWPQNMWLDGTVHWSSLQNDETAFPILLADALRRRRALSDLDVWPMVRRAATFLCRTGPRSKEDRWEENEGYVVFTLAIEVAAFLAAADFAEEAGEKNAAEYLRATADSWNCQIDDWIYARDTELARQVGVEGYYIRVAPPDLLESESLRGCRVRIKNRPDRQSDFPASQIVSPDALALVRYGLRAAEDPRIVNTVRVIDAVLKTATATGPVWHRYTHDGYGETAEGAPFTGAGIGRGWPLLAGERAHYEIAAGRREEAKRLLEVMEAQTTAAGVLPEQVWDSADIPERGLFSGRPSGSAAPLVWAHAEYLKLLRSLEDGAVFDQPPQTVQRYLREKVESSLVIWRFDHQSRAIAHGKTLRIELLAMARVHWSSDDWQTPNDAETRDSTLGVHFVDLPTADLAPGARIVFTFHWREADRWEGKNFEVAVKDLHG